MQTYEEQRHRPKSIAQMNAFLDAMQADLESHNSTIALSFVLHFFSIAALIYLLAETFGD